MPTLVLATKLFIPPRRALSVPRARLVERLNEGLQRSLTVISAPAGFGKTTLLSEWVAHCQRSEPPIAVAWLSLEEQDGEVVRFLTYLVAALQTVAANAGREVLAALDSPQPPPAESLLTMLLNDLTASTDPIALVLDDYHLIDSHAVDEALAFLLAHLLPHIHVVLATRADPNVPLARLRARGQLVELRAADLLFTPAEAAAFLNQVMGLGLTDESVSALVARTEGWAAGLQLAALALQGAPNRSGAAERALDIESFTGNHHFVLDYLVDEVLNRQPDALQDFLLQTSILDRLTAPLCDAVTGQPGSQDILEALDHANLFVIELDHERRWFRYHHLFADLLRQKLQHSHPDRIPTLHVRASHWYAGEALLPDAIRHALAARDFDRAADLAEIAWPAWTAGHRSLYWLDWVRPLPEAVLRDRPALSVACAQALVAGGQLEAAEARLQDVERCLARSAASRDPLDHGVTRIIVVDEAQYRALPARLVMTRAYLAQARGDASATVRYVDQALDLLPDNDYDNRSTATSLMGLARWTQGDLEAAYAVFSRGLSQNDGTYITGVFVLADMQMALGHLRQAEAVCERGLALSRRLGPPPPIGTETIHTALSHIHREQGDLEAAARDLETARGLGEQIDLPDWKHRWFIAQARLRESQGSLDQALEMLDVAGRHHVRTPVPDVRPIAASKAKIQVKQGKVVEARQWASDLGLSADDPPSYFREFEHVTLARMLIAQSQLDRDPSLMHAAHGLLDRLATSAEAAGRVGSLIDILVLKALAYEAQGNLPAALKPLRRALALAEPEGYFRVFVDEGSPMARLLYEALIEGQSRAYLQRLLGAFPDVRTRSAAETDQTPGEGLEPLSDRERDVLRLIADGLSNQAIGDRLFLALNTVKAHTRSIYGKLGVNSRTQAIARARALGLLTSA